MRWVILVLLSSLRRHPGLDLESFELVTAVLPFVCRGELRVVSVRFRAKALRYAPSTATPIGVVYPPGGVIVGPLFVLGFWVKTLV